MLAIANYVVIGILAFSVFWLVVGFLLGLWRGFTKSAIRTGTIIISALAAFLISPPIISVVVDKYGDELIDLVFSALPHGSASEMLNDLIVASPTLEQLVLKLPAALIVPLIFLVFFGLLSSINFIVYKILGAVTTTKGVKKTWGSRFIGAGIGTLASAIVIFTFMFPIVGYANTANDIIHEINKNMASDESDSTMKNIEEDILSPICEQKFISTLYTLGKKPYERLISFKLNGEKVSINKEVSGLFAMVEKGSSLTNGLDNYGPEQSEAVRYIANNASESTIIPSIVCEIVPSAAQSWKNGNEFLGINLLESSPKEIKPVITDLLTAFETMTRETLKEDLLSIADIFEILSENNAFSVITNKDDTNAIMNIFSNEEFVSSLLATLNENERFKPMIRSVTNLGLSAIGTSLGLPADDEAVYNNIMAEFADTVNSASKLESSEEKINAVSNDLSVILEDYGIDATPEETRIIAQCIINDFAGIDDVSSDDMINYFSQISTQKSQNNEQTNNDDSANVGKKQPRTVLSPDSIARLSAIKAATLLTGVENFEHKKATVSQMLITEEAMKNLTTEQIIEDGKLISQAIGEINTFYESLKGTEDKTGMDKIAALNLSSLSGAVQALNGTTILGNVSAPLVSGALQNMDLGLSGKTIQLLADGIANDKKGGEKEGYTENVMSSFKVMTELVDKLSDSTLPKEELEATIQKMLETITPDTATLVSSAATPSFIKKYSSNITDANAEKISCVLVNLFDNMAEETEMSEEEFRKEANAISILLSLGMKIDGSSANDLLNTVDENGNVIKEGKLGVDADYIIDTVLGSKFASETIIESNADLGFDAFGAGKSLTENNKISLCDAINKQLTERELTEKDIDVVEATCSLVGAKITISNGVAKLGN